MNANGIKYELSDKVRGVGYGGIGLLHRLAHEAGLVDAINRHLHLLKILSIVNRPGNRPSHEGAAAEADRAISHCRRGGFQQVRLRGDTDLSQTQHLDRWDEDNVLFQFGYDAKPNLLLPFDRGLWRVFGDSRARGAGNWCAPKW